MELSFLRELTSKHNAMSHLEETSHLNKNTYVQPAP